jgi:nucleotide-binding universal stress UspA family protein
MYRNILIPTDGSELAEKAVVHGLSLAKAIGARVTAVTVTEPFPSFAAPNSTEYAQTDYQNATDTAAQKALAVVSAAAEKAGVACETLHTEHRQVFRAILDAATAKGCDLIAMASHGRHGVAALVLGSETLKVLTHSTIPVLVCR